MPWASKVIHLSQTGNARSRLIASAIASTAVSKSPEGCSMNGGSIGFIFPPLGNADLKGTQRQRTPPPDPPARSARQLLALSLQLADQQFRIRAGTVDEAKAWGHEDGFPVQRGPEGRC